MLGLATLALAGCSGPPVWPARSVPVVEPTDSAVHHEMGFFAGEGGAQLYEQSWRTDGDPRGVVIFVHGLKDHSNRYARFAERLAKRGYAIFAFDLRGHGHSSGQRVGIDSFDEYIADLSTFEKRIQARVPNKPIFIFGHSMGGAIVTLYTLGHPKDVSGIVLSAAAVAVNVSGVKLLGTKMIAALFPRAGVFNLDLDDFSREESVVKEGKADGLVYPNGAPARTAKELLGAIRTIEERRGELNVPMLVLHGEADEVTDPEGSKALIADARSKDKTLKLYPFLVHDLLHEPEREVVMRDIEGWLDAHTQAAAPPATPPAPAPALPAR